MLLNMKRKKKKELEKWEVQLYKQALKLFHQDDIIIAIEQVADNIKNIMDAEILQKINKHAAGP